MSDDSTYYVTTPIYYVNAEPHLGHAYSTMAADVLARHMRQRGRDVFFLTGTDEHGEPIETAAEREGVTPQELVDRNAAKFEELMPIIDATNDFFIRTSDPRHTERVAEIIQRVYDNGWVDKGVYEGWYCPRCADFKTERELGPGQTCPIHEIELERQREENWFFRLSAFQGQLEGLYEERPDFVVPDFRRNEAVAFIKQGLEDVSLSRPKLKWGMRLPWDPDQRMYVWFDALLNYVTALAFAREGEDLSERYWPADLHVMAKDILKFHAVIWPALLWAADLEPPKRMAIHGFLLMGERKMSKSLGNVLDPFAVIDRFGADALRFYCFREVSFGQDGSISTAGFEARYETELANDFGNLASRVLAMIERYRDGTVPVAAVDAVLEEDFEGVLARFSDLLDRAELTQALEEAWVLVRRLNRYVEETQPVGAGQGRGRPRAPRRSPLQPRRGPAGHDPAARPLPAAERREAARRPRRGVPRARRARLAPRRPEGRARPAAVPEDRGRGVGGLGVPFLPRSPGRLRGRSPRRPPGRGRSAAWTVAFDRVGPERLTSVLRSKLGGRRSGAISSTETMPRIATTASNGRSLWRFRGEAHRDEGGENGEQEDARDVVERLPGASAALSRLSSDASESLVRTSEEHETKSRIGRNGRDISPSWVVLGASLGERLGAELAGLGVAAEGHRQVEVGEDHLEDGFDALPGPRGRGPRCRGGRGGRRRRRGRAP